MVRAGALIPVIDTRLAATPAAYTRTRICACTYTKNLDRRPLYLSFIWDRGRLKAASQ